MQQTLQQVDREYDAYIIDTCRVVGTGKFIPGAIIYKGRKKVDVKQWKKAFDTQEEANAFVKKYFQKDGIAEPKTDAEIWKSSLSRY